MKFYKLLIVFAVLASCMFSVFVKAQGPDRTGRDVMCLAMYGDAASQMICNGDVYLDVVAATGSKVAISEFPFPKGAYYIAVYTEDEAVMKCRPKESDNKTMRLEFDEVQALPYFIYEYSPKMDMLCTFAISGVSGAAAIIIVTPNEKTGLVGEKS